MDKEKLLDTLLGDIDFVEFYLESLWERDELGPLSDIFTKTCSRCEGDGYVEETACPDCDGEGYEWYAGRYRKCETCDGTGFMKETCPKCDGKGKTFVFDERRYKEFLRKGGEKLLRKYIRKDINSATKAELMLWVKDLGEE